MDSITESGKAEKSCSAEARIFEGNCASSWVSGFSARLKITHMVRSRGEQEKEVEKKKPK